MGAGPSIKEMQDSLAASMRFTFAAFAFVFLFILLIAVVWLVCFLAFAGVTSWPHDMNSKRFLFISGIALAMTCATLGIASATELVSMDRKIQLIVWSGFLGGVGMAVVRWLNAIAP